MTSQIKKIFQHELISGSTYFFIGAMVTNLFAFLFNFFVVRKLTPSDYGIYASLLSLYSLLTVLPLSFSTTIIQFATQYFSKNEEDRAKKLYKQSMLYISILGIAILIATILGAPLIGTFLHVSNMWFIFSIGILIIFTFLGTVNNSYLQSLLHFGFLSFLQSVGAVVKLLIGIVLLFLGFGIFGAISAVILSVAIPFVFTFIHLKFIFRPMEKKVTIPLWDMVKYALPSIITAIALSSFISTDVMLVKHFLSSSQAGIYAGLSLVGKVIFYFTGIIPSVMFPVLIRKYTKGHGVQNTFYLSLLLVGIPSLFLTTFYFLFPHFVLSLFLGGKQYFSATRDLGVMALFLSFYSIVTVMINFFLSLKQTKIVFPVAVMALLQIVLITLFHTTILQVILDSVIALVGLAFLLILYYIYHHLVAKTYTVSIPVPQEV